MSMKRTCNQCQTEMMEVSIKLRPTIKDEIVVKKYRKGFFNGVTEVPKAVLCPNCGNLTLYVEGFKDFVE